MFDFDDLETQYEAKQVSAKDNATAAAAAATRKASAATEAKAARAGAGADVVRFAKSLGYTSSSIGRGGCCHPSKGLSLEISTPSVASTLHWMLQKGSLNQDMFLMGDPGTTLPHIVAIYSDLVGKDLEYVAVSADLNESDLKQRREVVDGALLYVDQAPVRAAVEGKILLLDGVEKAERNVLSMLNNLLENREMALEDASFLTAAAHSAKGSTRVVSQKFQVIAIGNPSRGNSLDPPLRSRFVGRQISVADCLLTEFAPASLAPSAAFDSLGQFEHLSQKDASTAWTRVRDLLKVVKLTLQSATSLLLPVVPLSSLGSLARLAALRPSITSWDLLMRVYPVTMQGLLTGELRTAALLRLRAAGVAPSGNTHNDSTQGDHWKMGSPLLVALGKLASSKVDLVARLKQCFSEQQSPVGRVSPSLSQGQRSALQSMLENLASGADICLVGDRASGKTSVVRAMATLLGYHRRVLFCYKDMTSRDLLQRRSTDARGNTVWQNSPLLDSMLSGGLTVLDGIDRLPRGLLYSSLGKLLLDREVTLADGTRIVGPELYHKLLLKHSEEELLKEKRIVCCHPRFRVVALADWPKTDTKPGGWLDSEILCLFHFSELQPVTEEESLALAVRASKGSVESLRRPFAALNRFRQRIAKAAEADPSLKSLMLSLRQLIRVACHLVKYPDDFHGALERSLSARLRFLPRETLKVVDEILASSIKETGAPKIRPFTDATSEVVPGEQQVERSFAERRARQLDELEQFAIFTRFGGDGGRIEEQRRLFEAEASKAQATLLKQSRERIAKSLGPSAKASPDAKVQAQAKAKATAAAAAAAAVAAAKASPLEVGITRPGVLKIKDVEGARRESSHPELVPKIGFVDTPQHVETLRDMLADWNLGEHLLLIGNQGVGKNKLADRLLMLLNCEREYIQLHRDTTLQSLTVSQKLVEGAVVQEDSPLIRAARYGRCLVVDEADKAMPEVVCVLKALASDRELALGDGRRLSASMNEGDAKEEEDGEEENGSIRVLETIRISPDFRLIVLVNRPGYPFHGNDFYAVCGDCFSCHVVNNPDLESEVALLRSVGPTVTGDKVAKLALFFRDLRDLADSGQIAYPYSTRELLKVTHHLEHYRDDVEQVLADVFAFDGQDMNSHKTLLKVLTKHGFATQRESLLKAASHGDMSLRLDDDVDRSEGINPDNTDGTKPPDMREGGPRHGDWDGKQHIGGNQFAGGSGGTGTAGLGGRWGPYRLDVGQELVMVPEHLKEGIDEEYKKKATRMAQEAHAEHLRNLDLRGPDLEKYERLRGAIADQVGQMRTVLESHEAREKERVWLRQQIHGELDDSRLVDGVVGGRNIYRRRGEPSSHGGGGEQKLPKRLLFMLDISGSMYTFNRLDQRMTRIQELVLFLLEAFEGLSQRYDFCMIGHSGSGAEAERLVEWGQPPNTPEQRLHVVERMAAHAQFAAPGDRTLAAAEVGLREVVKAAADEYFVFLVSDADLRRYGITGEQVSKRLTADRRVNGYVILISNNTGEADEITAAVAPGRAHTCADRSSLATTFKTIFTHALRVAEAM